jgi:hypothetical protein
VKLLKDLLILIRCFLAPRQPPQRGGVFNGRIHFRRVRLSEILTTFIYTKEKKQLELLLPRAGMNRNMNHEYQVQTCLKVHKR